jgi:tetratricopeptide (TPR) repeat protein
LGMTQAELAEGIISVPYLSLIENEKAIPRSDILEPLAQRLQCTVNRLMGVTDEETRRQAELLIEQVQLRYTYDGIEKTEEAFRSLVELSQSIADSEILLKIDLLEIHLLLSKMDFKQSQIRLSALEQRWPQLSDDPNMKVWYLRLKGNLYFLKDQYQKALEYYREAERSFPAVTDEMEKAYIYGNLARSYLQLSNNTLGILYTEKCIEILRKNDHWLQIIPMLSVLGNCYTQNGEHEKAIDCYHRVLHIINQFFQAESMASNTYHDLGICYLKIGEYDRSIEWLEKSLAVAKEGQLSDWEVGYTHKFIAQNYIKKGDLNQARKHLDLAMSLLKNRKKGLADCYISLGNIHFIEGKTSAFIECYEKALDEYNRLEIPEKVAGVAHALGSFHYQTESQEQALSYLLKAVEHYRRISSNIDIDVELPTETTEKTSSLG